MNDYYSLDNILKYDAQYYIIFGERSNGKSYALGKYVLDNYFTKGEEFVICKRYKEDMTTYICERMLSHLEDYVLEKYGFYIRYYQSKWYCSEEDGAPISQCKVIGYAQNINGVEKFKGAQYPKVTTVVFEEFMSMKGEYLQNEIKLLMNLVSTIARKRSNVKVFLLGNTISKYSPYSEALGIRLDKLKHGEIITKEFKNDGVITKFAIERTRNVKITKNTNSFSNFGKVNSSMINGGGFEKDSYPRIINGVFFNESYKEIVENGTVIKKRNCFNKNDKLPFLIEYNGEYYNIYMKKALQPIFGIKIKNSRVVDKDTKIIINPEEDYSNYFCIRDIRYYRGNKYIENILNKLVGAFYNNDIVFESDDTGEDVITAFSLCGLRK